MADEHQRSGIRAYLLPLHLDDGTPNATCLFNQNQVVEILGPRQVQRIPCSPAYLQGVIAYHDELLPVIDLDSLCGREPSGQSEQNRQLMIIRTGMLDPSTDLPLKAVIASSVRIQITKISGQELADGFTPQEVPSTLNRSGLVRGFFQRHNQSIVLLDLNPVVLGVFGNSSEERCH
jgi:chemotaxis signal transduction protein